MSSNPILVGFGIYAVSSFFIGIPIVLSIAKDDLDNKLNRWGWLTSIVFGWACLLFSMAVSLLISACAWIRPKLLKKEFRGE